MAFNKENKIKWSEISPSLQSRFTALEDATRNQLSSAKKLTNGIRFTFSDTPPFNLKNNSEIWIDTKYRVIRTFADQNLEFTRAAWYGGDPSGITPPPSEDPETPGIDVPPYEPTEHTGTYLTHTESATSVIHEYGDEYISYNSEGETSVMYNFVGMGKVRIQITTNVTNDVDVGYLLGVTGANGVYQENGTPYIWTIKKGVTVDQTLQFNPGDWCVFDIDSEKRQIDYIYPGDKPNDTEYLSTYFPADYPYRFPISTWDNPSSAPPEPERHYEAIKGDFSVIITLTDSY